MALVVAFANNSSRMLHVTFGGTFTNTFFQKQPLEELLRTFLLKSDLYWSFYEHFFSKVTSVGTFMNEPSKKRPLGELL